ncbi:S-layer homology domain-containing protein [Cytobacillus massiliigabonensis]|uniref:S-layer homology domain-containing protein n=1 Tax=Cytobacillus massiliigabonensis TaxID=1871011 RepID=UPI0015E0CBAF|nr:S-layer homology domain-containing protein [Cytobacillus massiliigabonensis]
MNKGKMIKGLIASVVLASGLGFSGGSTFAAKNFTDLDSDKTHAEAVKYLNALDVFDYKTGTKLNGSAKVTRAEASVVLHSLAQYTDLKKVRTYKNNFKDLNKKTPNYKEIVWAYEVGLYGGDAKGNVAPKEELTRAQMAKILVIMFDLKTDKKMTFKDVNSKHWAYKQINILASNGITVGDGKGNFKPNNKVTLNQLSTFILRISNMQNEEVETGEVKTFEEIKKMAKDLYNSPLYQPEEIVFYTSKNFDDEFLDYLVTEDISQDLPGYSFFGRQVSLYVEKENGKYKNYLSVANTREQEDDLEYSKKMDKAEKYIVDNYTLNTDYDVVSALIDFVTNQFEYGDFIEEGHPYLLWGQNTVCTGYTDLMAELLTRFGLESRLVTGDAHAWNAVKLGGAWYYTDATFADGTKQKDKYTVMTNSERVASLNNPSNPIETTFKATEVPFDKSMALPYNYEKQKKNTKRK